MQLNCKDDSLPLNITYITFHALLYLLLASLQRTSVGGSQDHLLLLERN